MKLLRPLFLSLIIFGCLPLSAQVLEVPTLKSKGITGAAKTIEWHSYQAVQDKGLIYAKKDIETYDDKGRLSTVLTENYQNNQTYKTVYTLDKKGVLTEVKIVNPSNNMALRTTGYEYKKGLLTKTTQTQGTNTVVKNYTYNKQKQLIEVEVLQNGTLTLNEYYELDSEDRRTKISRKLPADAAVKVTSTFTYELKDGNLISTENRTTEQGQFVITKTMVAANRRDISEVTKRVSDGVQGINRQLFEDDAQGNWVKGEVIGDQYSRSRLVLRKLTYTDGSVTGRDKMVFPDDYHAQFYRKYSQMQVAINGKVYTSGTAYNLEYTDDRLTYVTDLKAWVLLKDYDKNSNMTAWAEAQVLDGGKGQVYWAASSTGIDVFNAGKKLIKGNANTSYAAYQLGDSYAAYIRNDIHKPFVAEHAPKQAGKLIKASLTSDFFKWAKVSDSTYVLTNRGKSVGLQRQIEDSDGNKLAMMKQGSIYYWYFLPGFREKFENTAVGDIHMAESVYDPAKFLNEGKFKANFSSFGYTKFADARYRLMTSDGQIVTNIASRTFRTPDDQLFAYFPLTQQYLQMERFYELEKGKEWANQKVSIVSDSSAYVYFMYNGSKSIVFYTPEGKINKRAFANHKLNPNKRAYGAVVYDSLNNVNYGMTYDLDKDSGFGPMRKLPANGHGAYLLKLESNRWVIFEKGIKVQNYDFSKISDDGTVIHFYKDERGKTNAMQFKGYADAGPGEIIYANMLYQEEVDKYLKEFGIDPELKKNEGKTDDKRSSTFDKTKDSFFIRDANGAYVQNQLAWNVGFGSQSLIAYDTVTLTTYELVDYFAKENIVEGPLKVLLSKSKAGFLKWDKNSVSIAVGGEYQIDVNRAYITENGSDAMWKELFYDQSSKKSYLVEYPSDSSFYSAALELLPDSAEDTYLFKVDNGYRVVVKGKKANDVPAESYTYQGDLIWVYKDKSGRNHGLRFKGYAAAKLAELLPSTAIPTADLPDLMKAIADSKN